MSPDFYSRETEPFRLVDCTNLYQVLRVPADGSNSDIQAAYHCRLAVLKDSDDLSGYLKRQYAAAYGVIGEPLLRKEYDDAGTAGVPDCANLFTASESLLSVTSFRSLEVYGQLTRAWKAMKCSAFKVAVHDLGSPAGTIAAVLTALRRRQAATLVAFVRAGSPGPANVDNDATVTVGFANAKDMSRAIGLVAKIPWCQSFQGANPQYTPGANVQFSVGPDSRGSDLTIIHGRQSPTVAKQVTIFLCDRARNHFLGESPMIAPCPADYGTSHQPDQTCAYWAPNVLITKAHEYSGLALIQGYAIRNAQRAPMSAAQMLAVADMQTEGIVAILHSHATPYFFGKGFQEYLTIHASIHYSYLLQDDAPMTPDMNLLREQTLGFGRGDLLQQHGTMVYMQTHHASWLRNLGPDKFLNQWRHRAVAQAAALLSPIHLLSGVTHDYYAVILIGTDYASVPAFMSYRDTGVCHIVHAPPGTNATTTGMPLQDVYLPLEFHCFMRHARMLWPADIKCTDFRDLLPHPVEHRRKRTAEHEPSTNPSPARRIAASTGLALAALQPYIDPRTMEREPSTPIHYPSSEVHA